MHTTTFDAFQFTPYYLNSCGSALDYVNVYVPHNKEMPLVKAQFPSMLGGVVLVTLEREYYVELLRRPLSFACVTYFLAQEAQGVCMRACMCANACMSSGARDGRALDEDQSGENLPSFWVGV